jgi:hypothetical protein
MLYWRLVRGRCKQIHGIPYDGIPHVHAGMPELGGHVTAFVYNR